MQLLVSSTLVCAAIGLGLLAFGRLVFPRLLAWRGIHMRRKTMFGVALVFDSADAEGEPVRLLNVDGKFQSICYVSDELWAELTCAYHRHFADALFEAGWPDDALVLGGGGFSFPKYLVEHDDVVRVDVCEIDPAIVELAREHFLLDRLEERAGGRMRLMVRDGWEWLRGCDRRYGIIVNDAFAGKRPLGPMGTPEGARVVHEHLGEGGLYLANVISPVEGRGAAPLMEAVETYVAEFGHVYVFPERPEHPRRPGNNAFVASERPLELPGALSWGEGS